MWHNIQEVQKDIQVKCIPSSVFPTTQIPSQKQLVLLVICASFQGLNIYKHMYIFSLHPALGSINHDSSTLDYYTAIKNNETDNSLACGTKTTFTER